MKILVSFPKYGTENWAHFYSESTIREEDSSRLWAPVFRIFSLLRLSHALPVLLAVCARAVPLHGF